jgi:hypothetical protein
MELIMRLFVLSWLAKRMGLMFHVDGLPYGAAPKRHAP